MRNILVLSNNAASYKESNGRTHINYLNNYLPDHVHNFYLRGIPDVKGVNYFSISNKSALFSKDSFGLIKPKIISPVVSDNNERITKASSKSKYPLFHLLRNYAYSHNRSIYKIMSNYIIDNNITDIMIWGSNIPFLYEYGYKLAKRHNLRLDILTGEDYPLKDYNYLSKHKSILFPYLQHKLYKKCKQAYLYSEKNIYACDELKNLYESKFNLSGGEVIHFPSIVNKIEKKENRKINKLLYGGNLYKDRVTSLIEIAKYLTKHNDVVIDVYGSGDDNAISMFNACNNIKYHGLVSFDQLLTKINDADLLLHVEGFSDYYVKDCHYAFSTKISDYYMFNVPFFIYGNKEISGVKFAYNINSNFVATNQKELAKLDDIIEKRVDFDVDYNKIVSLFSTKEVSNLTEKYLEK